MTWQQQVKREADRRQRSRDRREKFVIYATLVWQVLLWCGAIYFVVFVGDVLIDLRHFLDHPQVTTPPR